MLSESSVRADKVGRSEEVVQVMQDLRKWPNNLRQRIYDLHHNVDTWEPIPLDKLHIESENLTHGVRYDPTTGSRFRRIMKAFHFPLERFTFIDLGCGKGRVLLLASLCPFRRIVGVEFSAELARVAARNVSTYRPRSEQQCKDISVACMDAAHYRLPTGPLVIYMYNPFREQVMKSVLNEIKRALEAGSEELYVAYLMPKLNQLLKDSDFLVLVQETPMFCIFKRLHLR
jgi:predicted RNA methylase